MIIRVRSNDGMHRIEVPDDATLDALAFKIHELLKLDNFSITLKPDGSQRLEKGSGTLKSLKINHGDIVYLMAEKKEEAPKEETPELEEDEVDKLLATKDGWIQRDRDPLLCKHGSNVRCPNCSPIPPWNVVNIDPWKKDGVKFIPVYSYLRKVLTDSGCRHPPTQRCLNCKRLAFEQPSYRLKSCTKHPPWPDGICTDCDPGAVRLDKQIFRLVDHVEFESKDILDRFLQSWRNTGFQRCGYLYGKYVTDDYIPLGIRAQVSAIYEPPQKTDPNASGFEVDPLEEKVDALAESLGLKKVGFIWTDLKVDDKKKLANTRDYVLSSSECLQMAKMQNKYPSVMKQAMSGTFGSKFVSVIVRANDFGEIEIEAYQVSNQCMALVKDGVITSSKDPKLMRVKKTKKRYIPDVMYKDTNEYNLEVLRKAEPYLPTEFFIIPVRHSAPVNPRPFFKSNSFPIENRIDVQQSLAPLKSQKLQESTLSDFHLLAFLQSKLPQDALKAVTDFVMNKAPFQPAATIVGNLIQTSLPPPTSSQQSRQMPPVNSARGVPSTVSPKEQGLINTLVGMGYSPVQAKEAVWATSASGLEAAVEFLSSNS